MKVVIKCNPSAVETLADRLCTSGGYVRRPHVGPNIGYIALYTNMKCLIVGTEYPEINEKFIDLTE